MQDACNELRYFNNGVYKCRYFYHLNANTHYADSCHGLHLKLFRTEYHCNQNATLDYYASCQFLFGVVT